MNSPPAADVTPRADAISPVFVPAADAPGFSRLVSLWTLYVLTLRQHVHGKRWMVIAGLCALCAGLVIVVRATAPDVPPIMLEFAFAFMFIPQAILPLLALIYASGIVRDEQEEQTMTYLLIRPMPKWAIYGVKLLATLTTTVVLAAMLTGLTYAAVYVGAATPAKEAAWRALQAASIHSLAVVTYCCLFGLISLLTKRTLVVGILYAMLFEGILANWPFSVRLATVIYYTRLIAYRTMSFLAPLPNDPSRTSDLAAETWQLDVKGDPGLLAQPQLRTCLIVLLAASAACAIIAAILFSVREFYVKTPEKA
jgi:ABC-2 type transport system permease protein